MFILPHALGIYVHKYAMELCGIYFLVNEKIEKRVAP